MEMEQGQCWRLHQSLCGFLALMRRNGGTRRWKRLKKIKIYPVKQYSSGDFRYLMQLLLLCYLDSDGDYVYTLNKVLIS